MRQLHILKDTAMLYMYEAFVVVRPVSIFRMKASKQICHNISLASRSMQLCNIYKQPQLLRTIGFVELLKACSFIEQRSGEKPKYQSDTMQWKPECQKLNTLKFLEDTGKL